MGSVPFEVEQDVEEGLVGRERGGTDSDRVNVLQLWQRK